MSVPPPASETSNNNTSKQRSVNWTEAEQEQLAISWVVTSTRPEYSNNMKGKAFFEAIATHFNTHSSSNRSGKMCMGQWRNLNPATLKFSGIYARLEHDPPSGTSPDTWIVNAMKIYQVEMKSPFKYLAAWQKLRYEPKWDSHTINQRDHPAPDPPPELLPTPDATQDQSTSSNKHARPDDSGERPIGGKAAKKQKNDLKQKATDDTARIEAMKSFTLVANRRADASEESNRIANSLMTSELKSKDLEIARAKEEDCPDEISKRILRGLKEEVAQRYQ